MLEYSWPGNIRELENLVKRYVIVGNEAQIIRELSTHKPIVSSVSALPAPAREDRTAPVRRVASADHPDHGGKIRWSRRRRRRPCWRSAGVPP